MTTFKILDKEYHKYEKGLLELAEMLHMEKTGASEGANPEDLYIAVEYISQSLEDWRNPPSNITMIYDEAVRMLLTVAVKEFKEARPDLRKEVDQYRTWVKTSGLVRKQITPELEEISFRPEAQNS